MAQINTRRVTWSSIVAAAPAMLKQFATEQLLAAVEAKRIAAMRLRVMHYERRLKAA